MIEKKIVREKFLEFKIKTYLLNRMSDVPIKEVTLEKTPLGERITIETPTPGLVIGRGGSNIAKLTEEVKERFNLESPQIKISDVKNPNLSAAVVAKRIANNLRNYGSTRFKLTGYKNVDLVMKAGAAGVEIVLSGKLPSARAKSWRFVGGVVKKTGYHSDFYVDKATESVCLKSGVVGIKVRIMHKDVPLPDKIIFKVPEESIPEAKEVNES